MSIETMTNAADAALPLSKQFLGEAAELVETPEGLIVLAVVGFIAVTLLCTLALFGFTRLSRKKNKPSAATGFDPLADAAPAPKRRSGASIGLARLRDEATDPADGMHEPHLPDNANAPLPRSGVDSAAFTATASAPLTLTRPPVMSAAWQQASLLMTLPFTMRPGLETDHADICGIGVEAVFFDPDVVERIDDDVIRLVPFLPVGAAQMLFSETDRETLRVDNIFAQPDAVMTIRDGLLVLEYKSKGCRPEDRLRWAEKMREKDLLQTIINALTASAELGRPAAAVLRTHDAVFFLRPSEAVTALIKNNAAGASMFLRSALGDNARPGLAAADFAALLAVPLLKRFPKAASERARLGERRHEAILSRRQASL